MKIENDSFSGVNEKVFFSGRCDTMFPMEKTKRKTFSSNRGMNEEGKIRQPKKKKKKMRIFCHFLLVLCCDAIININLMMKRFVFWAIAKMMGPRDRMCDKRSDKQITPSAHGHRSGSKPFLWPY